MIVAGFGFRQDATCGSLRSALKKAAKDQPVTGFATIRDKSDAACLIELAQATGVQIHAVEQTELRHIQTPTQSPHSLDQYGTGSVAEAAALAAAGPGARLLSPRQISEDRRATCALAIKGST